MKKHKSVYIILFLLISCSIKYKEDYIFSETSYKNNFLKMKGISVDTITNLSKSDVLNLLFDKKIISERNLLDSLAIEFSDSYPLSRFYKIRTSNKIYYFAYLQNTEFSISDIYTLIIKSESDKHFYFLNDCMGHDLFRFGDYNCDGNIEYAEIENINNNLLFYSLENGYKKQIKNMSLPLKIIHKKNLNETLYVIKSNCLD